MSAGRFRSYRGALVVVAGGLAGCNALLGTSDPTIDEAGASQVVTPFDDAATSDATVMTPPGHPDAAADVSIDREGSTTTTPDAGEGGAPCADACTLDTTECMADGVATCALAANGCTAWAPMTTCGPLQTCKLVSGTATCVCQPSICTDTGTACQGNMLATCGTDSTHCPYVVSSSACPGSDVCSNPAPNASCTATCMSTCTVGQTQCGDPSSLQTCGVGSSGCASYLAAVACPTHETCAGAVGTAACACNNACSAAGVTCVGTSVQTCSADANGCLTIASTTPCTTAVTNATAGCAAGVCNFACDTGFTLCNGACVAVTDGSTCVPADQ